MKNESSGNEVLSIDFEFHNHLRYYFVDYMDDYDDCYYQNLSSEINIIEFDKENDQEISINIGFIEVWLIQGNRAINDNLDIVEICNSIEQELYEYADSIYKNGYLNTKLDDFGLSNDVLVLHRIEIKKEYRGRRYGLLITKKIIDYLGSSCGAIVVRPSPLQFSTISKSPGWEDNYDTSHFESDKAKATNKLRKYWAKIGFHSTKRHSVYYLSMAYKLKEIT